MEYVKQSWCHPGQVCDILFRLSGRFITLWRSGLELNCCGTTHSNQHYNVHDEISLVKIIMRKLEERLALYSGWIGLLDSPIFIRNTLQKWIMCTVKMGLTPETLSIDPIIISQ